MGGTLTIEVVVEMFLLLLIGIGPKIALVPYVETTKDMDKATKAKVMRKMLATAGTVGLSSWPGSCTFRPVRCR